MTEWLLVLVTSIYHWDSFEPYRWPSLWYCKSCSTSLFRRRTRTAITGTETNIAMAMMPPIPMSIKSNTSRSNGADFELGPTTLRCGGLGLGAGASGSAGGWTFGAGAGAGPTEIIKSVSLCGFGVVGLDDVLDFDVSEGTSTIIGLDRGLKGEHQSRPDEPRAKLSGLEANNLHSSRWHFFGARWLLVQWSNATHLGSDVHTSAHTLISKPSWEKIGCATIFPLRHL